MIKEQQDAPLISIPSSLIDANLKEASGDAVKVLLAVLRTGSTDIKELSSFSGVEEGDILEALYFWKQKGILLVGKGPAGKQSPCRKLPVSADSISSLELSDRMQKRDEIRFLFKAVESVYGRPLTPTEEKGYLYINEYMGLPIDVILMAVEYCVSQGKANFNYIQKLCAGWADDEINTHYRAEEYIKRINLVTGRENQIREAFGIQDRGLTAANKRYIRQWFEDYHFSLEMIKLAYERAVNRIGNLSFPYINKILQNWKNAGITTPADVAAEERKRQAAWEKPREKQPDPSASYDIDEFESRGFNIPKID